MLKRDEHGVIDHTWISTIDEYQTAALDSAVYPESAAIIYPTLGLTGEAGEVADKVKKVIRDKNGDFDNEDIRKEIAKELSDVMWYAATLAHDLGYSLTDICQLNIQKLQSRKLRGVLHGSGDNR